MLRLCRRVFPFFFLLMVRALSAQVTFQDVPSAAFLDAQAYLRGISWVDVDGDFDLDVCVTGAGGSFPNFVNTSAIFINQGNGNFANTGLLNSVQKDPFGHGWADIDNDGDLDLYIAATWNNSGVNELWLNNGGASLTQVTTSGATPGTPLPFEGSVAWGDYDNDGFVDLYLARWNDAPNRLYHNNGNGTFTQANIPGGITSDAAWTSAGLWGDYDNDNDLDLYVVNYQIGPTDPGHNDLFKNLGNGQFMKVTGAGGVITDQQNSRTANWVDANNDGRLDLFVAVQFGPDKLYLNNGDGSFSSQDIGGANETSWTSNWGDYDNDGDQDLITIGFFGTDSKFWQNDGAGNLTDISAQFPGIFPTALSGSQDNSIIFVDYDLDGWLDLHLAQPDLLPDHLYHNLGDGGCKHWLELAFKGVESNRAGIGVTVRAKAVVNGVPFWQMRQVSAQTSKPGQNPLWQHFGLADAAVVDSLVVQWPSGKTCVLTHVAANQFVEIEEGCGMQVIVAPPASAGGDTTIEWCGRDTIYDLLSELSGSADSGGKWILSDGMPVPMPFVPEDLTNLLYYVQTNGACSDTALLTIIQRPLPFVHAEKDTTVEKGAAVPLLATGASAYSWQPFGQLDCSECANPIFTADTTTTFTVTGTNEFGCTYSDQVTVTVRTDTDFDLPNAFTPDGDGTNDVFKPIYEGNLFEVFHLQVYNRWGASVFETLDPAKGWDGRNESADPAPSDVYVYVATYRLATGAVGERKGDVTLLR